MGALMWGAWHFGIEGITILLCHRGVGRRNLIRTFWVAFAWFLLTFVTVYYVQYYHNDMDAVYHSANSDHSSTHAIASVSLSVLYSGLLMLLYGFIVFQPYLSTCLPTAWSKDCSTDHWLHQRPALRLYAVFWGAYATVTMLDVTLTALDYQWPFCLESGNRLLLFGIIQPFVVLKTLKDDCLYWQGLYSPSPSSLNAPLMGGFGVLRRDSVETMARLDEMGSVTQVHYGMVSFDDKHTFSAGASARVYKGTMFCPKKRARSCVAIKMLFCMELNKTVIDRFAAEIQLLNSLSDPNVIRCKGICIMPPALCMITEFCVHGSLYEFIYKSKEYAKLDWNRKISLILDCIRGVTYLHGKGILHGDIKSLNFLVTSDLIVKLGDLGEHRIVGEDIDHEGEPVPKNRNWSPPEILSGTYKVATESSDIYSLGMVISEVLTGMVPFDEKELRRLSSEDFFMHVYDGRHRPDLAVKGVPRGVCDIVETTWFTESQLRCTAMDLLERFLECFEQDRVVGFRRSVEDMDSRSRAYHLPSFCES